MNYRPRPGGGSLPPAGNPVFRGLGPVDLQESAWFITDVMLTGGGWHRPAGPGRAQPPGVGRGSDAPGGPGDLGGPPSLAGASAAVRAALEAVFAAGFTHHSGRDRARRGGDGPGKDLAGGDLAGGDLAGGFAPGGVPDQMPPGPELAAHLAAVIRGGPRHLSDGEVCGALAAWRRQASWNAWGELVLVTELDARRARPGGRPGDHVDDEVAALLTLTGRAAAELTGLARELARLPKTRALLAAGSSTRPAPTSSPAG